MKRREGGRPVSNKDDVAALSVESSARGDSAFKVKYATVGHRGVHPRDAN